MKETNDQMRTAAENTASNTALSPAKERSRIHARPATEARLGKRSLPRPWEAIPPRQAEPGASDGRPHIALTLVVMILMTLLVYILRVPNPNIILISGLTVCTSLYGYGAGIASAAIIMIYSMFFFSENHDFVTYSVLDLQKMACTLLGVSMNVMFIGRLKHIQAASRDELLRVNAMLRDDNLSLEQASAIDALTGTRNRFAFRRDYIKYQRKDIHAMMFDLDDFKHTNDTCGHAVGDYVLQHVGEALLDAFGKQYCYRYGGDEFLVICPGMDEEAFAARTEAVRERLHSLILDGRPISARFSAGYVYGMAELSADLRLMLRQADYNLYVAKERGKDQFHGSSYAREFAERLTWSPEGILTEQNAS